MLSVDSLPEYRPGKGDRFATDEHWAPRENDAWICCRLVPGRKSRELQKQGERLPGLILVPVVGRIS